MSKWIVFDMDGTLIEENSFKEVHKHFGVSNEENVEAFAEGKITSEEFMERDFGLWSNPHIFDIKKALDEIGPRYGSYHLIWKLREMKGYEPIGIVSGGLNFMGRKLAAKLNLDFVLANSFEIDSDGWLKGVDHKVGPGEKAKWLDEIAKWRSLSLSECVAVGDTRYDKGMLEKAGYGIAFDPKDEIVKEAADEVVEESMVNLLDYL